MSVLAELRKGERAVISGFVEKNIPAKYYELGLIPGVEIELHSAAPFNGPLCVILCNNGCKLALRKSEASCILIQK